MRVENEENSAPFARTFFKGLQEGSTNSLAASSTMDQQFDDLAAMLLIGGGVEPKLNGADQFSMGVGSQEDGGVLADSGDHFSPKGPAHFEGERK